MKERVSFIKEFITNCPYFYSEPTVYEQKSIDKNWKPETPSYLNHLIETIEHLHNPTKEDFEHALAETAEKLNVGKGKLIHPLRLAVSGMSTGPGMFDILFILGKDESIKRIKSAVNNIHI